MIDPYRMVYLNITLVVILFIGILIYRFVFPKKNSNLLTLLILISILPIVSIFRKGTYESGDLTIHTAFLINFYKNVQEGIFIPQWASELCGGHGCPVFLFEYAIPFYIASFFHVVGFSFLNSMKLLIAFSYVGSGITMYLWAKDHFGKVPGFIAAIFYLFAPYHLADMHFRVSVGEVLSFAFIPLLFLFSKKIIETRQLMFFLLQGINIVFLVLSHTSTTLAIMPIAALYSFILWRQNKIKKIYNLIFLFGSYIYGLFLCAFYWLPASYEIKYTWTSQALSSIDFRPIHEFLYSPARYGLLFQGNHGELRLIVGYAHLFVVACSVILLLKNKIARKDKPFLQFGIICSLVLFLMMLEITRPLWQYTPFLNTFVMPWRLLVPIAFITSFLAGVVVRNIRANYFVIILCFFAILSTILNWGNRKMIPEDYSSYAKQWSLYTEYFEEGNPFYEKIAEKRIPMIPKLVLSRPSSPLEVLQGQAEYVPIERNSIKHTYAVHAKTSAAMLENTFYFPGWRVFANDKEIPVNYENKNAFGKITFSLPEGLYKIDVVFTDTPVRRLGKIISGFSALILFSFITYSIVRSRKKRIYRFLHR